ncbi:MAG: hypothetical protein ACHQ1D_01505 [Nitrososphaerales archaeon]
MDKIEELYGKYIYWKALNVDGRQLRNLKIGEKPFILNDSREILGMYYIAGLGSKNPEGEMTLDQVLDLLAEWSTKKYHRFMPC